MSQRKLFTSEKRFEKPCLTIVVQEIYTGVCDQSAKIDILQ